MLDPNGELAEYLGKEFRRQKLTGYDAPVVEEFKRFKTPLEFYKRSKEYLYHLTAFSRDVWKRPYLTVAREASPPCPVLDYGCGIGADGLELYEYGYTPAFADYQSECTKYLRWRLKKRGLKTEVYDIEKDEIPRYPLLVSFAVIEHVPPDEQWAFVQRLAELGQRVVINMDYPRPSIYDTVQGLHYPVSVDMLEEKIDKNYTIIKAQTVHDGLGRLVSFITPEPSIEED